MIVRCHFISNIFGTPSGLNYHANGYTSLLRPTTDAFTSQVTVDVGSTFTDELEVRDILQQQLQYHSLGNVQVGPEGFTFRIFQGIRLHRRLPA